MTVSRIAVVLLVLAGTDASAAEVDTVEVTRDGDRYRVAIVVRVEAARAQAYAVFTDYEALARVNPAVEHSELCGPGCLHNVVRFCVGPFCRRATQTQTFKETVPERIDMTVIPERSDWRYGEAQWRFSELDETHAGLRFDAVLEPDFWVPPLIGTWLIRHALTRHARITAEGIEREVAARYD